MVAIIDRKRRREKEHEEIRRWRRSCSREEDTCYITSISMMIFIFVHRELDGRVLPHLVTPLARIFERISCQIEFVSWMKRPRWFHSYLTRDLDDISPLCASLPRLTSSCSPFFENIILCRRIAVEVTQVNGQRDFCDWQEKTQKWRWQCLSESRHNMKRTTTTMKQMNQRRRKKRLDEDWCSRTRRYNPFENQWEEEQVAS
jgi:hypothetical protein